MLVCDSPRRLKFRHPSTLSTTTRLNAVAHLVVQATLLFGLCLHGAQAQTVKLGGSGNGVATMEALAEDYGKRDPSFRLQTVSNLGTGGGLKALAASLIEVAMSGRDLNAEERAQGLVSFEYGRTLLVLGTSRKESKSISLQDAADLYAGRIAQWPDGVPVRIVLRPLNDVDTKLLSSWSPALHDAVSLAHARPGMVLAPTDQQSAERLERLPGSLGVTTLAIILAERRDLRVVPIGGVTPSVKALADNSYPYFKRMFLVTRAQPAAHVEKFLAFVRSADGRARLEQLGHLVPAN